MMKLFEKKLPLIKKRLTNIIVSGVILSAAATALMLFCLSGTLSAINLSLLINLIFLGYSVFCLFKYRISVPKKRNYFKTNIFAFLIYSVPAIFFAFLLQYFEESKHYYILSVVYSALFYVFKFFNFLPKEIGYSFSLTVSACLITAFHILVILVLPFCFDKKDFLDRHQPRFRL